MAFSAGLALVALSPFAVVLELESDELDSDPDELDSDPDDSGAVEEESDELDESVARALDFDPRASLR